MTGKLFIVAATVGTRPVYITDPLPTIEVKYSDGSKETLFSFYPDETQFTEQELIGLTRDEAFDLRHKKDVAYLQS